MVNQKAYCALIFGCFLAHETIFSARPSLDLEFNEFVSEHESYVSSMEQLPAFCGALGLLGLVSHATSDHTKMIKLLELKKAAIEKTNEERKKREAQARLEEAEAKLPPEIHYDATRVTIKETVAEEPS